MSGGAAACAISVWRGGGVAYDGAATSGKHGSSEVVARRRIIATWRQRYGGRRNVISMAALRQTSGGMAGVTLISGGKRHNARARDAYLFRNGGAVSGGAGVKGVAVKPRWRLSGGIWAAAAAGGVNSGEAMAAAAAAAAWLAAAAAGESGGGGAAHGGVSAGIGGE
jgi:hypothetical protein